MGVGLSKEVGRSVGKRLGTCRKSVSGRTLGVEKGVEVKLKV